MSKLKGIERRIQNCNNNSIPNYTAKDTDQKPEHVPTT
jgi:hypothetical protein